MRRHLYDARGSATWTILNPVTPRTKPSGYAPQWLVIFPGAAASFNYPRPLPLRSVGGATFPGRPSPPTIYTYRRMHVLLRFRIRSVVRKF